MSELDQAQPQDNLNAEEQSVHPSAHSTGSGQAGSGSTEEATEQAKTPEQPIAALEEQIAQLRRALEEQDAQLKSLTAQLKERERAFGKLQQQAASAVAKYRDVLLALSPEIPQDLVAGQTVEEIDVSMAKAQQMVKRIRSQLEAQAASERVPSGAPLRSASDLSTLSPAAKIAYGLARNER